MNLLFISPNFPPQFHLFCRALRAEGVNVLGVGDCPADELSSEVTGSLNEYVAISQPTDDALLRAAGYFTWRHGRIDRVDSLNEFWLPFEARLRDQFNIPGPRSEEISRHRSKSAMRAIFQKAGVPCTVGERFQSREQARAFARAEGYPLVFKPDVGVGAALTFKVSNDGDLEQALAKPLAGYVMERFCSGALTSYDGLADREGRLVFVTSHVYSSGIMESLSQALDVHYYNRREIPPALDALGRKVVQAFGVRERFFHIEFFEEPDGGFRALEINLRPPGGFTTDMMNFASDADVYALWAKVMTGQRVEEMKGPSPYHCAHLSRRYGRKYLVPHHELVDRLGRALLVFREIPPVLSGAMGNLMYMVRYPALAPLEEAIDWVETRA